MKVFCYLKDSFANMANTAKRYKNNPCNEVRIDSQYSHLATILVRSKEPKC